MEPTSSLNRVDRKNKRTVVTGSEIQSQANASGFITTDSEKS